MSVSLQESISEFFHYQMGIEHILQARESRHLYGSSVSLESMLISRYGEDQEALYYSEEGIGDWVKDKVQGLVDRVKAIISGIKAKFDAILQKIGLKKKEIEADPYASYGSSLSPEAASSGFSLGKAALVALGVVAGALVLHGGSTAVAVNSRKRQINERENQKVAAKAAEYDQQYQNTDEYKEASKFNGAKGKLGDSITRFNKEHRQAYEQSKKAAFNALGKRRQEFEEKLNVDKKKAADKAARLEEKLQSRFTYYWTPKALGNALSNLGTMIDSLFKVLMTFVQNLGKSITQRDQGLGRVGLIRYIGMVAKDMFYVLGSTIRSLVGALSAGLFGTKREKSKLEEPLAPPANQNEKPEKTNEK